MLNESFESMWRSGWTGKLAGAALVVLVAVASAIGWVEDRRYRRKQRRLAK